MKCLQKSDKFQQIEIKGLIVTFSALKDNKQPKNAYMETSTLQSLQMYSDLKFHSMFLYVDLFSYFLTKLNFLAVLKA